MLYFLDAARWQLNNNGLLCRRRHLLKANNRSTHQSTSSEHKQFPLRIILWFPLFYHFQLLHNKAARKEEGDTQWVYFSWRDEAYQMIKRVYSPRSIEHLSVHHSRPSLVNTSLFQIICGGKSPFWLSRDWTAATAVLSVRTIKGDFTQSAHSEKKKSEHLTPTFTLNKHPNERICGFRAGLWLSESQFSSEWVLKREHHH